jgi:hypothetical protein
VADPGLLSALLALVEPDERGDPMSPLRWTTKSLRHLADELPRQGHVLPAPTTGKPLRENEFSAKKRTHRSRTRRRFVSVRVIMARSARSAASCRVVA